MVGTNAVRNWPCKWSRSSSMDRDDFHESALIKRGSAVRRNENGNMDESRSAWRVGQTDVNRGERFGLRDLDQGFLAQFEQGDEVDDDDRHATRWIEQVGEFDKFADCRRRRMEVMCSRTDNSSRLIM
jgi:hypothetical protein